MILVYIIIGIIVFMGIRKFINDVLPILIAIALVALGILILIVTDSMKVALIIGACGIGLCLAGKKISEWKAGRNKTKLENELEKNYKRMGFMNDSQWATCLPKFNDKDGENDGNKKKKKKLYPEDTSFKDITRKFTDKIEMENITKNSEWFQPYLMYCIEKRTGVTLKKMLAEVDCPQLKYTHSTPDEQLLAEELERNTQKTNRDVPPYLETVALSEMPDQLLFIPTKYALKRFGNETVSESKPSQQEFSFDDL